MFSLPKEEMPRSSSLKLSFPLTHVARRIAAMLSAPLLLTVRFRKVPPETQSIPDMHMLPATPGVTKTLLVLSC